jgi:phosphate transport system permease protein
MSDAIAQAPGGRTRENYWGTNAAKRRVRRRYAADRRLQYYGLGSIGLAIALLGILFSSLIFSGYVAFFTTKIGLTIYLDPNVIDKANPGAANYRKMARDAFFTYFPEVTSPKERRQLGKLLSSGAPYVVRNHVIAHPEEIGDLVEIKVPLSDPFDQLYKGVIPREIDALSGDRVALFNVLKRRGVLHVENDKAYVKADVYINPEDVPEGDVEAADYQRMVDEAFRTFYMRAHSRSYEEILSQDVAAAVKARVLADPALVGKTIQVDLPLSKHYDNLARTGEAKFLNPRFSSEKDLQWFDSLKKRGLLTTHFAWELFSNADSRFPELAGLSGALTGSFLALLVCFLLSFPIGIATAFYLEEFAPKNRWTDFIEVNINNLAAVPSVVFGLLGLAVFLNVFGLPRSVPLVGGMVLALMTLPTIIVATRAALKAVPPSIREGGYGVGASKHQVMLHHVLPLALPGILTGTIIGLAQALGETAPLLLIGMNAFIPSIENMGLLQPAMALPTQIFSWADSPERGFVSRTSAAILILLSFLIIMNAIAVYLRQRVERKW